MQDEETELELLLTEEELQVGDRYFFLHNFTRIIMKNINLKKDD